MKASVWISLLSVALCVLSILPTFISPVSSFYQTGDAWGMYASHPMAAEYHFYGSLTAGAWTLVCFAGGILSVLAFRRNYGVVESISLAIFVIAALAQLERFGNYWVLRSSYDYIIWKC
jgi:hypothetical protein